MRLFLRMTLHTFPPRGDGFCRASESPLGDIDPPTGDECRVYKEAARLGLQKSHLTAGARIRLDVEWVTCDPPHETVAGFTVGCRGRAERSIGPASFPLKEQIHEGSSCT